MKRPLDPMSVERTETPSASYVLRRRYGPARYVIAAASWVTVINMLLQPVAVLAGTVSWDGGGSNDNWSNGNNWTGSPDNTVPATGDDVLFYQVGGVRLTTGVIDAGFTVAINSLTFGNSQSGAVTIGGTQALTINTGGLTVNSGFGAVSISAPITLGGSQSWNNNSSSTLTVQTGTLTVGANALSFGGTGNTSITAPITGTGNLTKTGNGTVTINNATLPNFGTVTLSGGTLNLAVPIPVPSVASSPTFWLDAAASSTIVQSGGSLSTWTSRATGTYAGAYVKPDQYNNGGGGSAQYYATGGPSSNMPYIQTGALQSGNILRMYKSDGTSLELTDMKSVFFVAKGGGFLMGDLTTTGNYDGQYAFHRGSSTYGGSDADYILLTNATPPGSAGWNWYQNGTTINPLSVGMSNWATLDTVYKSGATFTQLRADSLGRGTQEGKTRSGGGMYSEVLVFNTVLSDTDRQAIETYLNTKWFLGQVNGAVNLPSTHVDTTANSTLDLGAMTLDHTLGKFSVAGGATLAIANAKSVTLSGIGGTSIAATGTGTATISGTATFYPKVDITAASGTSLSIGPAVAINGTDTRSQSVTGNVTMSSLSLSNANVTVTLGHGTKVTGTLSATAGALKVANTTGAVATVGTADFSNYASNNYTVNTQAGALGVDTALKLPGGITATPSTTGIFRVSSVSGSNIADNSVARTLTFSGGTLTLAASNSHVETFTSSGSLTVPTGGVSGAKILLVGGGGGGGAAIGGGGGGGAVVWIANATIPEGTYTVNIGTGGTGGSGAYNNSTATGGTGGNTTLTKLGFTTVSAAGGGGGGRLAYGTGQPGGSGGGAGGSNSSTDKPLGGNGYIADPTVHAAYTTGSSLGDFTAMGTIYGNAGGDITIGRTGGGGTGDTSARGGGGAGAPATDGPAAADSAGPGGVGIQINDSVLGSYNNLYWAGGGGGAAYKTTAINGGNGGLGGGGGGATYFAGFAGTGGGSALTTGGNGGTGSGGSGGAGGNNTGGGGGGGTWIGLSSSGPGGGGGSGFALVVWQLSAALNLPNTAIAATATSTLDLGLATADHILGDLNLTGGVTTQTLTIQNASSLTVSGISADGASGALTAISGTPVLKIAGGGSIAVNASVTLTINSAIGGTSAVTKTSDGTLVLTATNSHSGATQVNAGTLLLSGTGSINSSSGVTISNAAKFITTSSTAMDRSVTFGTGGGTIGGTGAISSTVTIGANVIQAPGTSPGTQNYSGGLTWAGGGTLQFEINDASGLAGTNWDLVTATGGSFSLTASSSNRFRINVTGLTAGNVEGTVPNFTSTGTYKWMILDAAAEITGFAADKFTIEHATDFDPNNSNTGTWAIKRGDESGVGGDNTQLWLTYDPPPPGTYWAPALGGGGNGTWTSSATVWATGAGVQGFGPQTNGKLTFGNNAGTITVNDTVTADAGMEVNTTGYVFGVGTGTPKINLTGSDASANAITVGSGLTATISVALDGTAGMTKAGTGTLVLGGNSTYTGETAVNAGTLQVDGSVAAGSTVAVGTAGTLSGNGTINGNATLTGNGIINKSGGNIGGTLTVTAGGNWNGGGSVVGVVTVNSGTFTIGNIGNMTASSGVNIGGALASGTSVLGGTGTVNGNVAVKAAGAGVAGTINPNTAGTAGTLNVTGTVTFESGSTYQVDVGGGANNADKLAITGAASIDGTANLVFNQMSALTENEYMIATATSGGLDSAFTCNTVPPGYTLQATATQLSLKKVPAGTVIMFK